MKNATVILVLIILFFLPSSPTFLVAEDGTMQNESRSVCLVIENNCPTYQDHRGDTQLNECFNMGDILMVLRSFYKNHTDNDTMYEIVLPNGKTVWIKKKYCNYMSLNLVLGHGKKDGYPIFDAPGNGNTIVRKNRKNRFFIRELKAFNSGKGIKLMFNVSYITYDLKTHLMDYQEDGWVRWEDIELLRAPIFLIAAKYNENGYRQSVYCHNLSYAKAREFLQQTLNAFPAVYFYEKLSECMLHSHASALVELAFIYAGQRQYAQAFATIDKLERQYPMIYSSGRRMDTFADIYRARIYGIYMKQPNKAMACLRNVLINAAHERTWGFEYSSTCGLDALSTISDISKKCVLNSKSKLKMYYRAFNITKDPLTKISTALYIADLLRSQKRYKQAVSILKKNILKYPCANYQSWICSGNLSHNALNLMAKILLEDLDAPDKTLRICRKIHSRVKNTSCGSKRSLSNAALYVETVIMDYTIGSRDMVLENYRRVLPPSFNKSFSFTESQRQEIFRQQRMIGDKCSVWAGAFSDQQDYQWEIVALRLEEIGSYTPENKISQCSIELHRYPTLDSRILKTIPTGTEYCTLYPLELRDEKVPVMQRWFKIQLPNNGIIGWILWR